MSKKEMEEKQNELRRLRIAVIEAMNNYCEDVKATIRYYKLHNMTDKLHYSDIKDEEKVELFKKYEVLNFLKLHNEYTKEEKEKSLNRGWDFVRMMNQTNEERFSRYILNERIDVDGILLDDIVWTKEQAMLYVELAQKFGYKTIYYTNASSGALATLTAFVEMGGKIIGTCSKKNYEKAGLIIDITGIDLTIQKALDKANELKGE